MKAELNLKLQQNHPTIFRDMSGDIRKTCMTFGCECRDGWYNLIDGLCSKILEVDSEVIAVQVKEKFGGLRFYIGGVKREVSEKIYSIIDEYEELSYKICEICGKVGKLNNEGYWLKTRCNIHWED